MAAQEQEKPAGSASKPAGQVLAARLGFAGLIPLAVLALWLAGIPLDHPWRAWTIALLAGYSAVVLSFLGGIRFGLAIMENETPSPGLILLTALPPLGAWASLFIPPPYSFVLLAVAFAGHGAWDAFAGQAGMLPAWFARLRSQLTLGAVLLLILAFAATA